MQRTPARAWPEANHLRQLRLVEPDRAPWTVRLAAAARTWIASPARLAALLLLVAVAARAA